MKKSILTLLLLGSVAVAADKELINDNIKTVIENTGYNAATEYTLTFTLDLSGDSTRIMTLSEGWYLYTNAANQVGVTTDLDPAQWISNEGGNTSHNPFPTDGTIKQDTNEWLYASGEPGLLNNATITLRTQNRDGKVMTNLTVKENETVGVPGIYILDQTGNEKVTLDLNEIELLCNVSEATLSVGGANAIDLTKTLPIPEPTTATLSLLALAGLVARRRRR